MAVVKTLNNVDDNQDNSGQQTQSSYVNKPVNVSGSSASGSSAAPTIGASSSAPKAPSSSGNFTNLSNYLNANKNYNAQGGGLAGQVNQNLQDKGNVIQNQYNNAQQSFQTQADQGRVIDRNSTVQTALTNPSDFSKDNTNVSNFQKLLSGSYTGPQANSDTAQIQNKAQNLQSLTNLGNTESGRHALLNNLYGNSNYNQGQQQLDNLLIQANPDQMNKLKQAGQIPQSVLSKIALGTQQDQDLIKQYKQEAANTNQQTKGLVDSNILQQQQGLQSKLQNLIKDRGSFQKLSNEIGTNTLDPETAKQLGIPLGTDTYGVDALNYLTNTDTTAPTLGNVASSDDIARFQALSKLTSDPSLAGYIGKATALNPVGTFNLGQYNSAVANARTGFTNDTTSAQNAINEAQAAMDRIHSGYFDGMNGQQIRESLDFNSNKAAQAQKALSDAYAKYGIKQSTGQSQKLGVPTQQLAPIESDPDPYQHIFGNVQ